MDNKLNVDKLMWIEIRAGLLGFKKALRYTRNIGPGAGIALAALGRIIRAIENRWELSVSEPEKPDSA